MVNLLLSISNNFNNNIIILTYSCFLGTIIYLLISDIIRKIPQLKEVFSDVIMKIPNISKLINTFNIYDIRNAPYEILQIKFPITYLSVNLFIFII